MLPNNIIRNQSNFRFQEIFLFSFSKHLYWLQSAMRKSLRPKHGKIKKVFLFALYNDLYEYMAKRNWKIRN